MIIGLPPPPRLTDELFARFVDERAFGLVGHSDLWVAAYAPNVLTWNAAIVETTAWHSTGASHGAGSVMAFTGSAATATEGSFGEYASRTYDPNLRGQFLPPTWFPSIDDTDTTAFFREVAP